MKNHIRVTDKREKIPTKTRQVRIETKKSKYLKPSTEFFVLLAIVLVVSNLIMLQAIGVVTPQTISLDDYTTLDALDNYATLDDVDSAVDTIIVTGGSTTNTYNTDMNWSNITNMPAGFADDVDDTGGGGGSLWNNDSYYLQTRLDVWMANWNTSYGWGDHSTAGYSSASGYNHTVTVAKSGGNYTTIQGALDSITGDGWTVLVYPGTYTETITFKYNDTSVIGQQASGGQQAVIITQANANIVNFNSTLRCVVHTCNVHLSAAASAISAIEMGSSGSGKMKFCRSEVVCAAGGINASIAHTTGGALTFTYGKAFYTNNIVGVTVTKAAFVADTGSIRLLNMKQIDINTDGASANTVIITDNGTSGKIKIKQCLGVTIDDDDATNTIGVLLTGSSDLHEVEFSVIRVNRHTANSGTSYLVHIPSGTAEIRSLHNHFYINSTGQSYAFDISSGATIRSHFDDMVSDLPYQGDGTIYLVSSEEDGNLTVSRNITTDDIYIPDMYLSGDYKSMNEWFRLFTSAGRIDGGAITDNGNSTYKVSCGNGTIRIADDDVSQVQLFEWSTDISTPQPDEGDAVYVGIDYNSGSPKIVHENTFNWDYDTNFPLGVVVTENGGMHLLENPWWVGDSTTNILERYWADSGRVSRDVYIGGLVLGESGDDNKYVTITAGKLWALLSEYDFSSFDTSGADTYDLYWSNGSGGFSTDDGLTTWNNTHYDDGTGTKHSTGNNQYTNLWWYVEIDGNVVCLLGSEDYPSSASAEAESPPSSPPANIQHGGLLIGRMIVKKGDDTALEVQSSFDVTFTAAQAADHGNLAGLTDDDHPQYLNTNTETIDNVPNGTWGRIFTTLNRSNLATILAWGDHAGLYALISHAHGGNIFDQDLNTTDDVTFNSISGDGSGLTNLPDQEYMYSVWAEENAALAANGYEWAFGNGANTPVDGGMSIYVPSGWNCSVVAMSIRVGGGTANVTLLKNGVLQLGRACIDLASGQSATDEITRPLYLDSNDYINFRTTTAADTSGPCVVTAWIRMVKV